jgi:hypothetical protein
MMKRYTIEEIEQTQFYQMPKFLFEEEFKSLSNDAKVLYSLLRDRCQLSIKNKWMNEENEVFLIYTRTEMAEMLGISEGPVLKAINQLKKLNLFDEKRQGLNKPNLIFISHKALQ